MKKRLIALMMAVWMMTLLLTPALATQSGSQSSQSESESDTSEESGTTEEETSQSASESESEAESESSQSEQATQPAATGSDITTPVEDDDVIGLLLDGADYMSFNALRAVVRFQVPEELRGKTLKVYDYRTMPLLINNVEDVVSDEEGYVEIVLPSTGDFVVADVPYTSVYRLVLDLRYLDESLWSSAKTPDVAFDTDEYPIPEGDWVSSIEWREQEGLEPLPSLTATPAQPEEQEQEQSQAESGTQQPTAPPPTQPTTPTQPSTDEGDTLPTPPRDFPWGSYVVIGVSALLGIFLVVMFRAR